MNSLTETLAGAVLVAAVAWLMLRAAFHHAPLLDDNLADFDEHVQTLPIPCGDFWTAPDVTEDEVDARWHEIVAQYGTRGSAA